MTRTKTILNWHRHNEPDGSTNHVVERAGWYFSIQTPPGGPSRLYARHRDGRTATYKLLTVGEAKDVAFEMLSPAEAMAWKRDRATGLYEAAWDGFVFAYDPQPQIFGWYRSGGAYRERAVEGIAHARQMAVQILQQHETDREHGESVNVPQTSAQRLGDVLALAGIRYTPQQLAHADRLMTRGTMAAPPVDPSGPAAP